MRCYLGVCRDSVRGALGDGERVVEDGRWPGSILAVVALAREPELYGCMTAQSPAAVVHDNAEHQRYEAFLGEHLAGVLGYEDRIGARVLLHTVVEPGMDGHGIGSALVVHAMADARAAQRPIVPVCTFVQSWLERHPHERDMVAG